MSLRNLIFVLGDQLDPNAPAFDDADPNRDLVVMAEVDAEVKRHPNHIQRVVVFFAAMRHFRDALVDRGYPVIYQQIGDDQEATLPGFLESQLRELKPDRLVMTEPGRYELDLAFRAIAHKHGVEAEIRPDTHFFCSRASFRAWAENRKTLVMEHFYRAMRKRYGYLMHGTAPVGGVWNLDRDNRAAFGKEGPIVERAPLGFQPDAVTQGVIAVVKTRYPDLYGSAEGFDWPVTPEDAQRAVGDFVAHRLARFGAYQDAMWTEEPFLYHARLSTALNLKLINPRHVVEQAEAALADGAAPLNAVEGFIRQVLGWREFIRGVYWLHMPGYEHHDALRAERDLPAFYWTGETDMQCLRQVVEQVLRHGYAHHIQRLMVTGLFALLYGVRPRQVHEWYMAMFVDSVEWVTLPNTVGMSQWADGGIVGTKPYVATGQYIRRMSNYCAHCRFNPASAVGDEACPFTTLYWAFLMRYQERLGDNRRMAFQLANLRRKPVAERRAITEEAERILRSIQEGLL